LRLDPRIVQCPAVGRRLPSVGHAVVADHARDAEPIVGENAGPALRLRKAMPLELAPAFDRLLIAPDRKRQHLALVCETFEPLDRDEPVKLLELRPELFGQIEILPLPPGRGNDIKYHRNHSIPRSSLKPTIKFLARPAETLSYSIAAYPRSSAVPLLFFLA